MFVCTVILVLITGLVVVVSMVQKRLSLHDVFGLARIIDTAKKLISWTSRQREANDAAGRIVTFVAFCIITAILLGLWGINLIYIVMTLVLGFSILSVGRGHFQSPSAVQLQNEKEMRDKANQVLSEALQSKPQVEQKEPEVFKPGVEVGEQPINLDQTRRVVLEVLASIASPGRTGENK